MSQETSDKERLSGTLFGGLRDIARALGGLSTTLASVGIICLALGIVLLFFPDLRRYSYIVLSAGGGFVLASMAISFETVSKAVTSRRGKYSTNTTIMVAAFIGLVAVGNFLAFENSARLDVTATKQFSMAPQTLEILKNLDEPIEAKAFFVPGRSADERRLLEEFRDRVDDTFREFRVRSRKFSYEFIDPIEEPGIGREYAVTEYPTVVFESTDSKKRHQIRLLSAMQLYFTTDRLPIEQDFVTGLLIVTGQEQKLVYFLTGHGERDIQDFESDTDGFGFAHDAVRSDNYAVSTVNLSLSGGKETLIGEETGDSTVNMLVVASPRTELPEGEAEILDTYLQNGGKIVFLAEPDTPQSFRDFLARWGMVLGEGHIVDLDRSARDNSEILFLARGQRSYLDIEVVAGLTRPLDTTYFPEVAALQPAEGVAFFPDLNAEEEEEEELPKIVGVALAMTSANSWLIKDSGRNEPREGEDLKDFFFPAVAIVARAPLDEEVPASPKLARLVVFGDSDFASNKHLFGFHNRDFFLNSINWLVGDIPLANIRPKLITTRALALTDNEFNFMRYSGWLLLPVLMAMGGGLVWWRRR